MTHGVARCAVLTLAVAGLCACGGQAKPSSATKPLKPGLWRISTTVDHRRAGIESKPGIPVISFVCAAPDVRPAAVGLSFRKGCNGPIELHPKDGVWTFAETCTAVAGVVTEGMVWGDFDRAYLIERDITRTDAADPTKKTVVHESVSAKWLKDACDQPRVKPPV